MDCSRSFDEDSGCVTGSFSKTQSALYQSTPKEAFFTPVYGETSRKRKFAECSFNSKKLANVIESYPSTPKFSSTLNESLINNLENCHIKPNFYIERQFFAGNDCKGVQNGEIIPATPEKQLSSQIFDFKLEKVNSWLKLESSFNDYENNTLYANLRPKIRRSPKKDIEKQATPAKKCLFQNSIKRLSFGTYRNFKQIVTNPVIMENVFKYLSNTDLYRLSRVSMSFQDAIMQNSKVQARLETFACFYKTNKENYQRTPPSSPQKSPPGSPQKSDSPPGSPAHSNFKEFVSFGTLLTENQKLMKCPRCEKPSVVENLIAQCQNFTSCGYIFCTKCLSCSLTGPDNFEDKCQSSALIIHHSPAKRRSFLCEISNSSISNCQPKEQSIRIGSTQYRRSINDSSGFYSESDSSPSVNVRRNLSKSLSAGRETAKLFKNFNFKATSTPTFKKTKVTPKVTPVVSLASNEPTYGSPERSERPVISLNRRRKMLRRL